MRIARNSSHVGNLALGVTIGLVATACARDRAPAIADSAAGTIALPRESVGGPSGTLRIDDGGTGGEIPVVFVHSFGGSAQHWSKQLAHLRKDRRAIAINLRAHGGSAAPANNDYSVDGFSSDIAAVVDSLGLKSFVLVGHSLGGAAALIYAGTHSDRVAGLVLVGTPGPTPAQMSAPIIASLESDKYQQVMDDYMKKLLTNAKPEVAQQVDSGFRTLSREQSTAIIKAVFAYEPITALRTYHGPVLSITSDGEPDSPNALHHISPTMEHKTISGTSHWMHMDKPDEFNAMLDEFLKKLSPSPP